MAGPADDRPEKEPGEVKPVTEFVLRGGETVTIMDRLDKVTATVRCSAKPDDTWPLQTDKEKRENLRQFCLVTAAMLDIQSHEVISRARQFENYITGRSDDRDKAGGP